MALDASGVPILGELLAVCVLMALLALGRRRFEVDVCQPGFQVWWLVAIRTCGCTMGSDQWERSLGVIEPGQFLPRLGRVASFAPSGFSVQTSLAHALLKLPFMRISVTGSAIQVLPAVDGCRLLAELG